MKAKEVLNLLQISRKAVFSSESIASVFGRHRKSLHRNEVPMSMILRLADRGRDALISEEMMEAAYETRKGEPIPGN